MSNVSEWAITAGGNTSAPPDGAPENMLPGKVNDCMREIMAAVSRWYQDSTGNLGSTGGTLAYTLTTNSGYASLTDVPLLVFRMNAANTGAVTLNVDGLGAKSWRRSANFEAYTSGQLTIGQVVVVAYNAGYDQFYTVGPDISRSEFAAGTPMLFQQTSAPTGWTKQSTHDNKALRTTTGTAGFAGTYPFTDILTSRTILSVHLPSFNLVHTLTAADHAHGHGTLFGATNSTGAHTHAAGVDTATNLGGGGGVANLRSIATTGVATGSDGSHSHTVTLTGGFTGASTTAGPLPVSGTIHSGGLGTPIAFDVQYVDVIIAAKA